MEKEITAVMIAVLCPSMFSMRASRSGANADSAFSISLNNSYRI